MEASEVCQDPSAVNGAVVVPGDALPVGPLSKYILPEELKERIRKIIDLQQNTVMDAPLLCLLNRRTGVLACLDVSNLHRLDEGKPRQLVQSLIDSLECVGDEGIFMMSASVFVSLWTMRVSRNGDHVFPEFHEAMNYDENGEEHMKFPVYLLGQPVVGPFRGGHNADNTPLDV